MKKTVLSLMALFTLISYAQVPITNFFSIPMSTYAIVDSAPDIDQSASGAGLTWNFTNLTAIGINTDTYAAPTAEELGDYPGTTAVLTISTTGSPDSNNIFSKDIAGALSFTGLSNAGIVLNYATDNALLGTFPMSYLTTNTDAVAGTFSAEGQNGTFTGTITTAVDAHGTLNMNDLGEGTYSGNVTRLKVVQDLTLNVSFFSGTVYQTSYYYYDTSTGNIVFRSNTAEIVFAIAGIDETVTVLESFLSNPLSIPNNTMVGTEFQVVPNPVNHVLNINLKGAKTIQSIRVTDLNGRLVLSSKGASKSVHVSGLQSGLYIVTVQTDSGLLTKKFLKT